MDLGDGDRDVPRAWGANLAIRASAFASVGEFDPHRNCWSGDEEEWEERLLRAGGRIRYVAGAGLDHRRSAADATLRALARPRTGADARRATTTSTSTAPPPRPPRLRVLVGCLWHTLRRRCANGPVMAAHSWGRLERALERRGDHVRGDPVDDFLSGESGTIGGRRDAVRSLADLAGDVAALPTRARLLREGRRLRRRVLVLSVVRPANRMSYERALAELRRSRCVLDVREREPAGAGKFENLNALLEGIELSSYDWLLLLDDDVVLPRGFLAASCSSRSASTSRSPPRHTACARTRPGASRAAASRSIVRETAFVEIGPVTALRRETFEALLPFPPVGMGWGLDAHWSWLARERGWRIGIVDALPIAHRDAAAASAYSREAAVAQARGFLAEHPYLPVAESQRTLAVHRRCA